MNGAARNLGPSDRRTVPVVLSCVLLSWLIGCTRISVEVSAFRSTELAFPEPVSENTVSIAACAHPGDSMLEQEVGRKMAAALLERGYRIVPSEQARYVLFMSFDIDSGRTVTGVRSVHSPGGTATTHHYDRRGYAGSSTTYVPGRTSYVPYSVTMFTRYLGVQLLEKERWVNAAQGSDEGLVWKSNAVSTGTKSDLREIIDYLIVATMLHFGEDTGESKSETFFGASSKVKHLRELAREAPGEMHVVSVSSRPDSSGGQEASVPVSSESHANALPETEGEGANVIESRVDGEFNGFAGDTLIKLMDGSIWEQEEYYYHYRYGYMLPVTVYRSHTGSWKMQVQGVPKAVRVIRIR